MSEPRKLGDGLDKIVAGIEARKTGNRARRSAPEPVYPPPQPPTPLRVHPEKRGPEKRGGHLKFANLQGDISYYSPELIQCTLPHSDPQTRDWIRKNGDFALIMTSGIDSNGDVLGLPYGSFPRLVLAHIITRVVATRERRIELASYFGSFLKEVGYMGDSRGNSPSGKRLRDQLLKLFRASITFEYASGSVLQGRNAAADLKVATKYELWWDFRNPEQDSLFNSWIELSEDFYQAIIARPVPLRTDVLKTLKKSPLAIDVYMWVSYRLFGMQAAGQTELAVSFGSLQAQFGTGIAEESYRKFRQELKAAFERVAEHWRPAESDKDRLPLHYEFTETGLVLYRSPLLVRRNKPTDQEEAARILAARTFDSDTQRKARTVAGNWSVDALMREYFAWIEQKNLTPADPKAHFLAFVKRHVKRNQ